MLQCYLNVNSLLIFKFQTLLENVLFLIPWNTCGAYQSGVLGVGVGEYFIYAGTSKEGCVDKDTQDYS